VNPDASEYFEVWSNIIDIKLKRQRDEAEKARKFHDLAIEMNHRITSKFGWASWVDNIRAQIHDEHRLRVKPIETWAPLLPPMKQSPVKVIHKIEMNNSALSSEFIEPVVNGTWKPDLVKLAEEIGPRDVSMWERYNIKGETQASIAQDPEINLERTSVTMAIKRVGNKIADHFELATRDEMEKAWKTINDLEWGFISVEKLGGSGTKAKPDVKLTLKNKKDGHLKIILYNCKAYYVKGNAASIEINLGAWDDTVRNDCHAEIKEARKLNEQPNPPGIEVKTRVCNIATGNIFNDTTVDWTVDYLPDISIPIRGIRKHGKRAKKR
jgi:hypothetical protein